MMLGTSSSSLLATDAAAAAAAAEGNDSGGGASGGSGEVVGGGGGTIIPGGGGGGFSDEENKGGGGGGGGGGNRWPRQETLALLKIRSEMGVAFRDSSLKGPLWEEVSRKMAELGYQRSSKKCKEKFENVYKYHKRTKEGRASKPDGKTYRFFEQLEALESNPNPSSSLHHHQLPPPPPPPRQQQQQPPVMAAVPIQPPSANNPPPPPSSHVNVTVSSPNPVSFSPSVVHNPIMSQLPLPSTTTNAAVATNNNNIQAAAASHHHHHHHHQHSHHQHPHPNLSTTSNLLSDSTSSSSTSSDEDIGRRHNKKKRKFKDFFERLMKDVIDKQEELQRKFLETLEKRERDRMIREEAWRVQEMARMNRELDLLAQERSMAAAKDSAIMQFLQKVTGQQNLQTPTPPSISVPNTNNNYNNNIPPTPNPVSLPENHPSPQPISVSAPSLPVASVSPSPSMVATQIVPASSLALVSKSDNGPGGEKERENFMGSSSSSRWPKAEVQALINLRTNLDMKYQENGPKGPLWEEISAGMSKLGYSRSAKRCKEKWENINKYFKKVKESNKKRPEDSKTCPYFHQLEALYKEKAKSDHHPHHHHVSSYVSGYSTNPLKPENNNPNMVPIMARPEQQWPQEEDHESDNMDQINDHDEDDVDDDDDEDEDGSGSGGYEIVTNKTAAAAASSSVATTTAAE
ncbi:hypothetical protein M9H77_31634 [Catharanthus roseus]|uniref:Uncharacterized protein n=1 Tax=Catharanthus roseus TaxID=4058 RepID=A0ACC0A0N2_CATRO|nr:hypothetical protein M9H77_31634 [Catharanthus roseus]